ncbi:MAG: 50S ribosomal protein L31e [Candidatus Bathyarchaeia archaeon]
MVALKEEVKEETKKSEDIVEERIYTVPLNRAWIRPRTKRAPRAIRLLKAFIRRHMKVNEESIKILNEVNERIWSRGIQKPPRRIVVRVTKDKEGTVTVHLAEGG